jgi:predicted TIM-barrel fold metal-dependent hydrolase
MSLAAHAQEGRLPIIDMHLHGGMVSGAFRLSEDGKPRKRPCYPAPCDPGPAQILSGAEIIPRTLEAMRKYNIVLGVVSDHPPIPKDDRWVFDDWASADQDRFIFGYSMKHPTNIALDDLRDLLVNAEINVIGELGFQYSDIAVDDPILEPIFDLADELDVPVHVHHGGMGAGQTFPIHLGNPLRLSKVLRKHPTMRIYVENASFPYLEEIAAVMLKYPNVYADLSTALWAQSRRGIHTHIKGLVELGLSKRLMFGSDQMMWPETIEIAIETIESADFLTEEEKRDIFYNNAARFLRLPDSVIARHHRN